MLLSSRTYFMQSNLGKIETHIFFFFFFFWGGGGGGAEHKLDWLLAVQCAPLPALIRPKPRVPGTVSRSVTDHQVPLTPLDP